MTIPQVHTAIQPARAAAAIFAASVLFTVATAAGAGNFFESKPTELESRRILRDLETVQETPDVHMPRPGMYTDPPQIIEGSVNGQPDAKLYYFAKYQTVNSLLDLFNDQFVKTLNDNNGDPLPAMPYTADINLATHQIIVSCPSVENAKEVLYFFEQLDVVPIQVHIDCVVSEVYADHTLDWETRLAIQNLFGQAINLAGKLPGAALRDVARSGFGLKGGYVRGGVYSAAQDAFIPEDDHMFGALVDVLASRGYLKILMSPQLDVVNGQTATIKAREYVTLDEITITQPLVFGEEPALSPRWQWITDSLEITPQVFSDGTIGLKTEAVLGSKATPEGVKQTPIFTERKITISQNRIRQGESLIIGGITKSEQRSVVRGVPGLKEIPILGVLFSSKDFEERAKEVLFILTPTISSGGLPNKDITANVQRKQTPVKNSDLMENLKDPLGTGAYTELVEDEAIQAEVARVRAEMEKAAAARKNEELLRRIAAATQELEQERKEGERLASSAREAVGTASLAVEASKTEADAAKTQAAEAARMAEQEKANTLAALARQQKALDDAQKAAAAAAAAQAAMEKAQAEAAAAKAAAEAARKEAEAKQAQWLKIKEQADRRPAGPRLDDVP